MTKDELLNELVDRIGNMAGIESAGKIEGEDSIGVATREGEEYFLTLEDA